MPRLFFALWPDDDTRSQIHSVTESLPSDIGRITPLENIHITLVFMGTVDPQAIVQLEKEVSRIRGQVFQLCLDEIGHWRKPQILWLTSSTVPKELQELVMQLNNIAADCGIKLEGRPYQPHLTLMRKVKKPIPRLEFQAIDWKVDKFVLVESVTHPEGVSYSLCKTWVFE